MTKTLLAFALLALALPTQAQVFGSTNATRFNGTRLSNCVPVGGQVYAYNSTTGVWECASAPSPDTSTLSGAVSYAGNVAVLRDFPSVKDRPYLAKGDGVTDDTAAIAAALAANNALYFPPGVYKTSAVTWVGNNKILRGAGQGLSVIWQANIPTCGATST